MNNKLVRNLASASVAAAIAGRKPARIIKATIVGPIAAYIPEREEIAKEVMPVTIMQHGRSKRPSLFRGFVKRETKCRSHLVKFIVAAKPIDEQITMISELLVIDLSNCSKAAIGSRDRMVMIKPDVKSTKRVS